MSYTNLLYHIVYGTKDRLPLITSEFRPRLHDYLGGIVNGLHATPLEINGTADHVHVLARIRPVISISEFLSKFKSISSGWARRQTRKYFKRQVKYGAFTVSESQFGEFKITSAIRKLTILGSHLKRSSRLCSRVME
jgi:putative transposase